MRALRFRSWWVAGGIVLALAIAVASLLPPKDLPSVQLWDKFEHAFAYFALAAWFGGVLRRDRYPWLAIALVAFGIGIEVAQGAMGIGRTADLRDVLADAVGIAIGVAVALLGTGGWMHGVERWLGVAVPTAD